MHWMQPVLLHLCWKLKVEHMNLRNFFNLPLSGTKKSEIISQLPFLCNCVSENCIIEVAALIAAEFFCIDVIRQCHSYLRRFTCMNFIVRQHLQEWNPICSSSNSQMSQKHCCKNKPLYASQKSSYSVDWNCMRAQNWACFYPLFWLDSG